MTHSILGYPLRLTLEAASPLDGAAPRMRPGPPGMFTKSFQPREMGVMSVGFTVSRYAFPAGRCR